MPGCFGEEVLLRSDGGVHRRDQFLPDGVQGRVGHLGKKLLEVMEEQLRLVGQDGQRRVVAHGPDGFSARGGHGTHEDLQLFARVSEGPLPFLQSLQVQPGHVVRFRQVVQVLHVRIEPGAVGPARTDLVLDLLVGDDAAPDRVDQEQASGLQPAPREDAFGRDLQHAGFGGADDEVVLRHDVPEGPQSVAVQRGADPVAVARGDEGRTVPRLHEAGVVFVEGLLFVRHGFVVFPGLWDHHHQRVGQGASRGDEQFQRVVEPGRVARAFPDDGAQLVHVLAEERGREERFAGAHPVLVAPYRVDLAVVAEQPVGMGQPPGAQRVRAVPGMDQGQGRDDGLVGQVAVEGIQLVCPQQALVDDGLARQARDVEVVPVLFGQLRVHGVLDDLADDVELALEPVLVLRQLAPADEELPDQRRHLGGQFAGLREIHRHVAPAKEHLVFFPDRLLDRPLAPAALFGLPGQEDHAGGVFTGFGKGYAAQPALSLEKGVGKLEQQPRPVARVGIASAGAAMLEVYQHADGVADDVVGLLAIEIRNDTDAARVVLIGRIVQPLGFFHIKIARQSHPFGCENRIQERVFQVLASNRSTGIPLICNNRHGYLKEEKRG